MASKAIVNVLICATVVLSAAGRMFAAELLTPFDQGRYLPGLWAQTGKVWVGQGQAGWHTFDITGLAGLQISGLSYRFTQRDTTNEMFFPLQMAMYDVSAPYDRLRINREFPLDPEGEAIAEDLHSGNVYATFTVTADTEGNAFDISLNPRAILDLQTAINTGSTYYSLAVAGTDFFATGYFAPEDATLVVTPAPEPGSVLLFGTGAVLVWSLSTLASRTQQRRRRL